MTRGRLQRAAHLSMIVICLFIMLAGCNLAEIETCRIFLGKDIRLDRYGDYSIVNGSHMVFEYYHEVPEKPFVTDTGMSESLVFQLDPGEKKFTIVDEDLIAHATTYRYSAFSPYRGPHPVSIGTLIGAQESAMAWDVEIDVVVGLRATGDDFPMNTKEIHIRRVFRIRQ